MIAKFDRPGLYVWHCHILSHEEHDMMRPFFVGEMNKPVVNNRAEAIRESVESELQLKMMPNPFSNYVTVQFSLSKTEKVSINLYDAKGSLIKKVLMVKSKLACNEFLLTAVTLQTGFITARY